MANKFLPILTFFLLLVFQAKANIEIFEVKGVPSAKDCTGSISIKIDGNSGPYDISAINGTTNSAVSTVYTNVTNGVYLFSGLCVGDYNIFVVDKNATIGGSATCKKTLMASVVVCQPFDIVEDAKSKIVCGDDKSGFIEVSIKGGVPPYKYLWSSGQTTEDISGLEGGKGYDLRVIDKQGCGAIKGFIIDCQKITLDIKVEKGAVPPKCDGVVSVSSINSIGVASGLTFQWSNTTTNNNTVWSLISGFCAGNQSVTITSSQGCSFIQNFDMKSCSNTPAKLTLSSYNTIPYKNPAEYCDDKTPIRVEIKGGTPPIEYSFNGAGLYPIQKGVINKSGTSYVDLKIVNNLPVGKQIKDYSANFIAKDICEQTVDLDLSCCDWEAVSAWNLHSGIIAKDLCDSRKLLIHDRYHQGFSLKTKKYTIKWPDNTESIVELEGDASFGNHIKVISGSSSWKAKEDGYYEIVVTGRNGCHIETYCVDMGNNKAYCGEVVNDFDAFAPAKTYGTGIYKYAKQSVFVNSYLTHYCGTNFGGAKGCKSIVSSNTELNSLNSNKGKFDYIPVDKYNPCVAGVIKDACGQIFEMTSGEEFFDSDKAKDNCVVECACLFDYGQLNKYPYKYKNLQTLVKTKKSINHTSIDCSQTTFTSTPPLIDYDDYDCPESDIIAVDKANCYFDIYCKTDLIEKNVYIPKKCVRVPTTFECVDIDKCGMDCQKAAVVEFCDPVAFLSNCEFKVLQKDNVPSIMESNTFAYNDKELGFIDLYNCDCLIGINGCKIGGKAGSLINTQNNDLGIYPNPFLNQIYISTKSEKNETIDVILYDLLGKKLQSQKVQLEKGFNNFDIEFKQQLPQGMYYLQIISEDYKLQYPIVHQ